MKRRIKAIFLTICLFSVAFLGIFGIRIHATGLTVSLEQQESTTNSSIRYISTAENLTDLSSVTDITVKLSLTKNGNTIYANDTITTVYTSVSGESTKQKADNTYYAVYTLTNLSSYSNYTLGCAFVYNLADSTTVSTNTITYLIPATYTVTEGSGSFKTTTSIDKSYLADSEQEGVIFHAWDWSMTTIKEHLSEIKAQGFTTIQTSPMQPQKDYYSTDDADAWWKLYQPLGFSIATKDNALGTKDDLKEMVTAAHELGLKVIVDVVSNHLAGSSDTLAAGVKEYESKIYGNDGTISGGALLHSNTVNGTNDSSAYSVTTGNIGMPDLDTSNSYVQERVLSLLKEYIDVGVDGFRFDAAKHIETPSDGDNASSYWTTVLDGATAYAQKQRSFTPYYYGEILNTPGTGRSWSYYTGMMSITDNVTGNNARDKINSGDAASAAASGYNTGESASKLVLWGESHDTYSNNSCESTFISQSVVDKAYALCASRSGASSLYFARPTDGTFGTLSDGTLTITCTTALGAMGSSHWQASYIGAVNKFHNYWVGNSECLGSSGSFAYNVRYNSSESGMVIVNTGSSTSVSITGASKMLDGTYYDLVTGNEFTVSSGTVTGTMDSSGIAVLYSSNATGTSAYVTSSADSVFSDSTMTTTFTIANAVSATVTINGVTKTITNGSELTLGSDMSYGESKTVTVTLTDSSENKTTTTFTFEKVAPTTVFFVNNKNWDDVYAHMWSSTTGKATTWPGVEMTDTGKTYDGYEVYSISFTTGLYDSIIFNNGVNPGQTQDIKLSSSYNAYKVGTSTDSEGHYDYTGFTYGCVTHTPADSYSYDDNNHYHLCTVCGQQIDPEAHIWNSGVVTTEATDDTDGVKTYTCTVCGKTKTEVIPALNHTHVYTLTSDSTVEPTRTTAGKYVYICSCGATTEVAIPATGTTYTYFENTNGWSGVCAYIWDSTGTNGSFTTWDLAPAMSQISGTNVYYYEIDLTKYDRVIFKYSSYQTEDVTLYPEGDNAYRLDGTTTGTKYNVESFVYLVQCADDADTWSDGILTKKATCSATGTMKYVCTVCGKTKTEEVAKLAHTASATYSHDVTNHYHVCTVCGEEVDATAHTYEAVETKAATETEDGLMTYTCTVCGYSYTQVIPSSAHVHSYTETVVAATCEESGYTLHKCACGDSYISNVTAPLEHSWEKTLVTAPSVTVAGSVTYTCSKCSDTKVLTIAATGNNTIYFTNNYCWDKVYAYTWEEGSTTNKDAWPGNAMTKLYTNDQNQDVYYIDVTYGGTVSGRNRIIFNNGNGNGSQTVDISFTTEKLNAYYVTGTSGTSMAYGTWSYYTEPTTCTLTHTWNSGEVVTAATTTSTGTMKYTCTVCGDTKTVITPKTHDHVYATEYSFDLNNHWYACTADPACNSVSGEAAHTFEIKTISGEKYNVCSVCGYEELYVAEGIKIHYKVTSSQMGTGDHQINTFYIWSDGSYAANHITFTTYTDSFGYVVTIPYTSVSDCTQLGLIIKCNGTYSNGSECWADKDGAANKYIKFSELTLSDDNYYNVYLVYGSDEVYKSVEASAAANITSATVALSDSSYVLTATLSETPTTWSITKNGATVAESGTNDSLYSNNVITYNMGTTFPDMSADYEVVCNYSGNEVSSAVTMWDLYSTSAFESAYGYDGDLGAIYSSTETVFKVWSPVASAMKLRIYESGTPLSLATAEHTGSDAYTDYTMTLGEKGVWTYTLSGDQSGVYYNYVVTNYKFKDQVVTDPYAKSTGVNGLRGMVVDFSKTNPDGWSSLTTLAYEKNSLAVYEAHIADLTASSTWGGTEANAKKFLGFCETGTTYTADGTTVTTGFDHIKELGVNAVQLLPIFDGSGDETDPSYNWGYNPLNYNALEGAYSSDPYDGYARIKEFKQLMYAYNQAGIEIIMDVVFNHVSDLDTSSFNYLMPGYYYRYSGKYPSNGSGCGSETCSERYMMRKFMIDTTEFWATEYKIGGFRFDLMGVHDTTTMNKLASNLKTKVSANCVVYGEPWSCGCTTSATLAELSNLYSFDGYGNFNSSIRDGLLGNTDATNQGWIAGEATYNGTSCIDLVKVGVEGYTYGYSNNENSFSVQYASCHDNYLIKDHLEALGWEDADSIKKAAMLTNSVVLTSRGVSFIAEGEEFLRTKNNPNYTGYSIHNTYNAPYEVNALDYSLKITNADMVSNYKKLVALKKSGVFTKAVTGFTYADDNTGFYYTVSDGTNTYVIIHHNGASDSYTVSVSGTVYLDTLGTYSGTVSSVTVGKFGTVIVKVA